MADEEKVMIGELEKHPEPDTYTMEANKLSMKFLGELASEMISKDQGDYDLYVKIGDDESIRVTEFRVDKEKNRLEILVSKRA